MSAPHCPHCSPGAVPSAQAGAGAAQRPAAPTLQVAGLQAALAAAEAAAAASAENRWLPLPGGVFRMGSNAGEGEPGDGEAPERPVQLSPFVIAATTVSNRAFARFVAATGHVTYAEEAGCSFVFAGLLPDDFAPTRGVADAPWWREVHQACWYAPEGPGSSLAGRLDHPVVHVSWFDAMAYARWAGRRLPSEAQWEYAARGGLVGARFPWGDELLPEGQHRCNIWQGRFPAHNSRDDGWAGTAPVDAFAPNGLGLYNTSGNVWEWCADWFSAHHDPALQHDPIGPGQGTRRLLRGGSFLCHESYCNRYRVSARMGSDPTTSTSHIGFRCAGGAAPP